MIKFGIVLMLFVFWFFAVKLDVSFHDSNGKLNKQKSKNMGFIIKSTFYWVAIFIAMVLGAMCK